MPFVPTKYRKDSRGNIRLSSRHTAARLLVSVLASLLVLGVVAAELPELMSLADDTSNDFVIRKASHGNAPSVAAPTHSFHQAATKPFVRDARNECAGSVVVAEVDSSELFLLHSVLRR